MGGGMMGQGNQPSMADLYSEMDADGDGAVTQAEFVTARPDDVSEEDSMALYATIDTDETGSITEDEFTAAMSAGPGGAGGPPAGGGAGGTGSAGSSDETYDALDTNEDGVVSETEFLAAHPADVTDEQASALFDSIDTEGTGSITREQFATFMSGSRPDAEAGPELGADLSNGIAELLALLGANSANAALEDTALATV
jgi:Ca2+-binding EF-hand superfamily protein